MNDLEFRMRQSGVVTKSYDANWEESKHPRADNGQFSSGNGGSSGKEAPVTHGKQPKKVEAGTGRFLQRSASLAKSRQRVEEGRKAIKENEKKEIATKKEEGTNDPDAGKTRKEKAAEAAYVRAELARINRVPLSEEYPDLIRKEKEKAAAREKQENENRKTLRTKYALSNSDLMMKAAYKYGEMDSYYLDDTLKSVDNVIGRDLRKEEAENMKRRLQKAFQTSGTLEEAQEAGRHVITNFLDLVKEKGKEMLSIGSSSSKEKAKKSDNKALAQHLIDSKNYIPSEQQSRIEEAQEAAIDIILDSYTQSSGELDEIELDNVLQKMDKAIGRDLTKEEAGKFKKELSYALQKADSREAAATRGKDLVRAFIENRADKTTKDSKPTMDSLLNRIKR